MKPVKIHMSPFIHEPLYPSVEWLPWEEALFHSKYLRRLKHLAHFGVGSLLSPVVHSRFEHTVGVWKLAAIFFPDDLMLRAAAILHDVGHLPFSHSVEKTLGFNHHDLTEEYIKSPEIETILARASLSSDDIIDYLNAETPLTGTNEVMGIDHLDSFFRDTYMFGGITEIPRQVLERIYCTPRGIETDLETGMYLLELVLQDHQTFLSPELLAADRLLAEAIKEHFLVSKDSKAKFPFLTDDDLLIELKKSPAPKTRNIIELLTKRPFDMEINNEITGKGIPFGIRKIYSKTPLIEGKVLGKMEEAQGVIRALNELKREYEIIYPLCSN
ncbi:HD domain-containing protein [Bacillus horti]|uniref:HD superfamily phosphohydrolase n=1 Tax=Caldalkalibacillus horti TaxID=77523 RepID=A0ABT9VYW2_9BACI|nr:HD domain-containing protein [Bacillus horti]MDQ0166181.1 HD superfamily phosphohydrolase [Bacillus horti]